MRKTEVYSWRLTPSLKRALEEAARSQHLSVAELLEQMSREWLRLHQLDIGDDDREQARLRAAATRCFGRIHGGDPTRSETARARIRGRLARRSAG